MSKKKKKQKIKYDVDNLNELKNEDGVILVRAIAVSPKEHQRILDHLASLPCDFSPVIHDDCEIVHFEESYYGLCPACGEEIYTKFACPECGRIIDFD